MQQTTTQQANKAIDMAKEMEGKFQEKMKEQQTFSQDVLPSKWFAFAKKAFECTPPFALNISLKEFWELYDKLIDETTADSDTTNFSFREISLFCNAIDAVPLRYYEKDFTQAEIIEQLKTTSSIIETVSERANAFRAMIQKELKAVKENPLKPS